MRSQIRDFCSGGMHLVWDCEPPRSLQRGDPVEIRFRVDQDFYLEATVARVFENGVGVAISDFPPAALQALQQEHAGRAGTNAALASAAPRAAAPGVRDIQTQCRALVEIYLPRIMATFFEQARNRLFELARDAANNVEQREFFDARAVLQQQRGRLESEIIAAILRAAEHGAAGPEGRVSEASGLSLVGGNDLEYMLATAELSTRVENHHKRLLYELEQRFSALLGSRIDLEQLPGGPQAFADAFGGALHSLNFKPKQLRASYKLFSDVLVSQFGELGQAFNDLLANAGLELPGDRPVAASASARTPASPTENKPVGHAQTPIPTEFARAGHELHSATDSYQHVQNLLAMQRAHRAEQIPQLENLQMHAADSPFPSEESANGGRKLAGEPPSAARSVSAARRRRGAQDIDMLAGLFHAMDDDPGLGEALKQRLRRLQFPIYRAAAAEPGFFSRKNHPARRALAQLVALQPLLDAKETGARAGIEARLDRVIAKITQDGGRNEQGLGEAERELTDLLALTGRQYEQELARVVDECRQGKAARSSQGGAGSAGPVPSTESAPLDVAPAAQHEWSVWRDAAKRLKVGDPLFVPRSSAPAERQALAWIGEDSDAFVLVDSRGRKTSSLSLQELVSRLRSGQLTTAKHAERPVVERALYTMASELHGEMGHRALHDPVTGLPNRKKFLSNLQTQAGRRSGDSQQALLYLRVIDIEPLVNRHGEAAKNSLLKKLSALVQERLGDRAVMGRVDDLEFAILLTARNFAEACEVANQLLKAVRRIRVHCKGDSFAIKVSIGVVAVPDTGADSEALLESACEANEAAKAQAEVIRASTVRPAVAPAVDWSAWLDQSLVPDKLQLYGRRILPLRAGTGALPYAELAAGLRLRDRILVPGDSLDACQAQDRLAALDLAVIAEALAWMTRRADAMERLAGCSIRLCAASLKNTHLLGEVLDLLMESPVPPARLCFEITEAALVASFQEAQVLVRTLKEFGCRFTLGGFGKTDAGRDCLSKLPMDYLKIDGLFVGDLEVSQRDYAVVKSANEIGHLLGMQTIAADVEAQTTLARVREIGFDYAQGSAVAELQAIAEFE